MIRMMQPPQVMLPGLTLAQAAGGQRPTQLSPYPQPLPQPQLPAAQSPFLPAMPQPNPLEGTIQDPQLMFRGYSDDELLNFKRYPAAGPGMLPLKPGDMERLDNELGLRGLGPPDLSGAPTSPQRAPYETQRSPYSLPTPEADDDDPEMAALVQSILTGGAGGSSSGGTGSRVAIPGLPSRPSFDEQGLDFGPMPEAPVFSAPDFSKANAYFEAAKPQGFEKDPQEMGLAVLAGALGGFDPSGSVGEILGRMAGPGMQSGYAQYRDDREQGRQSDRDLQAWNAAMGSQQSQQAGTLNEVANQNTSASYGAALEAYKDAQNRYNMADERNRWEAQYELQRAGAELQRAQLAQNAELIQAKANYWNSGGGRGGSAGGLNVGSVLQTISNGVNQGALPGIEGINEQLAKTKQAILAAAQADPNQLALYMGNPQQLDIDARRNLTEQIFMLAQENPELMMQIYMASAKGKTDMNLSDIMTGLGADEGF